jgi:hypothetical protein
MFAFMRWLAASSITLVSSIGNFQLAIKLGGKNYRINNGNTNASVNFSVVTQ